MNPVANYCMKMLAAKKHKPLTPDPAPQWDTPLHFWALEDGSTVALVKVGSAPGRSNLMSMDGSTWEAWDGSAVTLDRGGVLYVKAAADAAVWSSASNYWKFNCTGQVCVGGQLRSIVEKDNFCDPARANTRSFSRLFYQNYGLISAETLRLTQDAVTNNDKYSYMFYECINLRRGPEITPRSCTAADLCAEMFRMCIRLDTAPVIRAASVTGTSAFNSMFLASGIRRALNLLPTHFPYRTCYYMFSNCTALETVGRLKVRTLNSTGSIGGEFQGMYAYCSGIRSDRTPIDVDLDRINGDTFNSMFYRSTIRQIPRIRAHLQNEATARTGCFSSAFADCFYIEDASCMTVTCDEIYNGIFNATFSNCISLKKAPTITAKTVDSTLARNTSFASTFSNCFMLPDASSVSITATSTNNMRFGSMFAYCRSLTKAPRLTVDLTGANQASNFYYFFIGCNALEDASSVSISGGLFASMFEGFLNGCTSLTKAPRISVTGDVQSKCYMSMFASCMLLTDFPRLPVKGPAAANCCQSMFYTCRSMTEPPITFEMTGTNTGFCNGMFQACSNLKHAPANCMNATANTFADAYRAMFQDCINLVEAPEIMLQTNTGSNGMTNCFYGCMALRYIKTHQKNWTGCSNWVNGVRTTLPDIYQPYTAAGGGKRTFICPSDAPQTRGASAIPTNWTLETFIEA